VELVNRINAFLRRMQRFGYLHCRITVAELMNKSDHDLFCKLCAPTHALNHLLPPTRNRASMRTRRHSYQLPEYATDLHKKSFLIRSLHWRRQGGAQPPPQWPTNLQLLELVVINLL